MKRLCSMLTSLCLLSGAAIAQQTPGPIQPKLTKMMQNASAKNLEEAKDKLIFYYHANMFEMVDKVLTQYPQLVNTKIKGKNGREIPVVYYVFLFPKRLTKSQQQLMQKIEALDHERDELHEYANGFEYFSKEAELAREKDSKLYEELSALELQLDQEKSRNASAENPMLALFYKHGAKCEQCLKESFTRGPINPTQRLTLLYQLPVFGASAEEIVQVRHLETWIPLAKQIAVTPDSLRMLLTNVPNSKTVMKLFELAYSKDPATQRLIASYKTTYKRLQSENADEERTLAAIKLLRGQLDLVSPLLKRFPTTDFKGWKYYAKWDYITGYNLADGVENPCYDCYFTEPVVVDTKRVAYSINLKKFGTRQKPKCVYVDDVDG